MHRQSPRPWPSSFPASSACRSTRRSWSTRRTSACSKFPINWNDVGDWRALATLLTQDTTGNAIQGNVVARDTTNSIIVSDDGGLVATLGVDDLVVVHSGKATLVARKRSARQAQGPGRRPGRRRAWVVSVGAKGFPPCCRSPERCAKTSVAFRSAKGRSFAERKTPFRNAVAGKSGDSFPRSA